MGDNMQWNSICPSEAGIPENKIDEFLNELAEYNVELDSLMMISKGNLIYENYFKGWNAEKNHRMYSVGKSFTAIAIGLLKEEGKLSLEDPICDYFKDKLPKNGVHPYIAEMKIKHLLTMTTAHKSTTYKRYDGDWVESFFCVEPERALYSHMIPLLRMYYLLWLPDFLERTCLLICVKRYLMQLDFQKQQHGIRMMREL